MGNILFEVMFAAPEINPINRKAKSVPLFNPVDKYGRVFLFSWLGFMVAFMSWYVAPDLRLGFKVSNILIFEEGMRFHHWYVLRIIVI